jgi:hypothetical protein
MHAENNFSADDLTPFGKTRFTITVYSVEDNKQAVLICNKSNLNQF